MKKITLFALILFSASILRGQIIRIDIDSIADNEEIVLSKRWHNNDSVRIVTYKVNGQVYGDSTTGNFNLTVEWKLDTTKAVKKAESEILAKRKAIRDQKEADLKRFYERNPDLKPKAAAKQSTPQVVLPKSYDVIVKPTSPKKRKWYQRKKNRYENRLNN